MFGKIPKTRNQGKSTDPRPAKASRWLTHRQIIPYPSILDFELSFICSYGFLWLCELSEMVSGMYNSSLTRLFSMILSYNSICSFLDLLFSHWACSRIL
jgi:hypothetical protein